MLVSYMNTYGVSTMGFNYYFSYQHTRVAGSMSMIKMLFVSSREKKLFNILSISFVGHVVVQFRPRARPGWPGTTCVLVNRTRVHVTQLGLTVCALLAGYTRTAAHSRPYIGSRKIVVRHARVACRHGLCLARKATTR